jgi:hypothetical protein
MSIIYIHVGQTYIKQDTYLNSLFAIYTHKINKYTFNVLISFLVTTNTTVMGIVLTVTKKKGFLLTLQLHVQYTT